MAATGIQPWVNGPVDLYVGTGSQGALEKLGFSENGVNLNFIYPTVPFHSDDMGAETPQDIQIFPPHAFCEFDLNQWDEAVWTKVQARTYKILTQTGLNGAFDMLDPGSFLRLEGYMYRLLLDAPYAAKTAFTGMTPYNFLAATLEGQVRTGPLSTRPKKHAGLFHAIPTKRAVGGGVYVSGNYIWTTYNASTAGKPVGL